jgi:predicted amidohydrolase
MTKDSPTVNNYQDQLTVAVLSLDIVAGNVEENLHRVAAMLAKLPAEVDIAVLPELFTTSFMKDTEAMLSFADPTDGLVMTTISQWAANYNLLISGSFLAKDADRYYNRGFIMKPDGERIFYDKHHLFCLSQEAKVVTHGEQRPPIVNYLGWNVSMMICYELRFPVWGRNIDMQADIVLLPANWPDARGYAWRQLLIARAIENQVIMVGANRSGVDDFGSYHNLSLIADQLGRQIAPKPLSEPVGVHQPDAYGYTIPTEYGEMVIATCSLTEVKKQREKIPTVRDADKFSFIQ